MNQEAESQNNIIDEAPVYCARHPKEQTGVRCATCGTPICPRCMVSTPVGMKCRDCGTGRKSPLYKVRPERLLLAYLAALIAGAGTVLLSHIGFLVIFVSMAYGYFAGSVILKASGMKRGIKLEIVTGVGMVIGALAANILPKALILSAAAPKATEWFLFTGLINPFFWIALAIATSCAVSKIRYL
ncbi:MAG: B-box zinc finger protein [Armatimonadota bacterium]|nr:B-box zinc finger protein [Armatimonadota bacterium]